MLFLTESILTMKQKLFSITLGLFLLITLGTTAFAQQTEEELGQEIGNYLSTHTESETRAFIADKISQMTTQEIWFDHSLSIIAGFFLDGSECIRNKQRICDLDYETAMVVLTGESAILAAACVLITSANPGAFIACAVAVSVRHAAQLRAATLRHQACYARARLECFPPILSCIPQPQIVAWCTDYNFTSCTCDGVVEKSPIVIDVLGNGFSLTNAEGGVGFDITGTGKVERLSWTNAGSDDAFLALDRNSNGTIDNGTELFGNFTDQPPPLGGNERNGFWALTGFDSNADGRIDKKDAVFDKLRLWQDSNHNGISERAELHKLAELGLKTIDLDYHESRRRDEFGNQFRYRAKVKDTHDAQLGRWAWDVFLLDR